MSDQKQSNATSISGAWLRDYDLGHLHADQNSIEGNKISSGYRTGISDYQAGIRVWTGTVKNPQVAKSSYQKM